MSIAFLLTALVIVAAPGTGALFTITTGIARGRRASTVAAFGCTLGIVPHLLAAITGTAVLLRAGGVAFEVLKFAGVGYLLLMAVMTWRESSDLTVKAEGPPRPYWHLVRSAVLVNLLNPKLTLFFFAFLPQFVPHDGGRALPQMLVLSAVFMAMTLIVFVLYGAAAAAVRTHLLEKPRLVRRMRRVFALSFVALGAKLARVDG